MKKQILIIGIIFISAILLSGCIQKDKENASHEINESEEPEILLNNPPKAKFIYSNDMYTVTFVDQSSDIDNDTLVYTWYFGDGSTSTEQSPIHIYDCSETNVFDIILTVNDGELNNTYTKYILFGSHLEILEYSQTWIGYESYEEWGIYEPVWIGYISMTVENSGNLPAEISHANMWTKDGEFYSDIRFNFTYTYDELIEGGDGNGLGSEIWITVISNNTLTLSPGKTITLTSNPELTYLMWGAGTYPVNIWLFKQVNGKDISHTLYETIIQLT